jgi:hypothetical protein
MTADFWTDPWAVLALVSVVALFAIVYLLSEDFDD